jgi:hypothetical protein
MIEGFNTPGDNPMALRRISLPASERRCDILRQTLLLTHPLKSFGLGRSNSRADECILGD